MYFLFPERPRPWSGVANGCILSGVDIKGFFKTILKDRPAETRYQYSVDEQVDPLRLDGLCTKAV